MPDTPKAPPTWLVEGIGRVHDWDDERSLTTMRNFRTAIASDGGERTADHYRDSLSHQGFHLIRVIPTAGPMSIVEAVPVVSS